MIPSMIVFGEDWGRHPSSTQHLARRFARDYALVWVNSIGMRRPRLTVRDLARAAGKVTARFNRPSLKTPTVDTGATPPNMSLVSPVVVPWPGSRAAATVNRALLSRQIGREMSARNLKRPILWTSLPTALPVVGHLDERAVVYYCGDDFGALAGVDHAPVLEMEQRLVEKADLVIAASERLAAKFPSSKTLLLPHGADVGMFSAPTARAADLPRGPVAGFYGSVADWIDVDLLARSARRLPDWTFVLIGKIETDVNALKDVGNVAFLGPRPHHALPSYSQHWDVSLLPFRDCPQITACNPLKLLEYMAAGREIVSTPFPALEPYRNHVSLARDVDEFVAAIAASRTAPDRAADRRARVAAETWEARAARLSDALAAL